MKDLIGKKVLVTTQEWFYGKDGKTYKAVHGTLKGIVEAKDTLGFSPNRTHANWYVQIGDMTVVGCQVYYMEECEEVADGPIKDWYNKEGTIINFERPSNIYKTW